MVVDPAFSMINSRNDENERFGVVNTDYSDEDPDQSQNFQMLSDSLLASIFSLLIDPRDLASCCLVSRRFNGIADDRLMWYASLLMF